MFPTTVLLIAFSLLAALGSPARIIRPPSEGFDAREKFRKTLDCYTTGTCGGGGVCCGYDPLSGTPGTCITSGPIC